MKSIYLILFLLLSTFTLTAQYNIIGDAVADGSCYALTPAQNGQSGAIWYLETIDLTQSFSIRYDLRFGIQDGNGADGIAFVMQPISNSEGSSGGGIGYVGINPSLAIEMDTYQNGSWNDPSYDHIGLQSNGNNNHASADALAAPDFIVAGQNNVEDGAFYYFHVQWDAITNNLRCWINCDLRIDYTGDIVNDIFGSDPNVFWGFTAATGALNNFHVACPVFVSFEESIADVQICEGDNQQVQADNNFTGHTWSPPAFFDNPNISNPNLIPTVGTHELYWEGTDQCGDAVRDTFQFVVNALPSLPPTLEVCTGDVLDFSSYGFDVVDWNFPATPNPLITEPLNVNVDVTLNGCSQNQTVSVSVKPLPELFNPDIEICPNTEITLNGVFDNVTWNSPATALGTSFTAITDVIVDVDLELDGCTQNQTFTVTIAPEPSATSLASVCANEPFSISGNFDSVTWNSPNFSGTDISITENTTLDFDAQLGDCILNFTIPVSLEPQPEVETTPSVCIGETIELTGNFDNVNWVTPNNTGNSLLIEADTNIELEATLGSCSEIINLSVSANDLPNLDTDYTACKGTSINITGNFDSLDWLDASETGNSLTIIEPRTYLVEATLGTCKQSFILQTDTLDCTIPSGCIEIVPNAFSPNNDGWNDSFYPQIVNCELQDYKLSVFNRWGQVVFSSNNLIVGWNGTVNGEKAEIGVYPFIVEYTANDDPKTNIIKGNVTVVW